jgi:hypothetical protein
VKQEGKGFMRVRARTRVITMLWVVSTMLAVAACSSGSGQTGTKETRAIVAALGDSGVPSVCFAVRVALANQDYALVRLSGHSGCARYQSHMPFVPQGLIIMERIDHRWGAAFAGSADVPCPLPAIPRSVQIALNVCRPGEGTARGG